MQVSRLFFTFRRKFSVLLPTSTEKYYFDTVKKTNRNEVFEFLNNNFRVEEPLSKAAGMTETDIKTCFDGVLQRVLKNEVSILAREKRNDQVVGCMLNSVWKRGDAKKNEDIEESVEASGIVAEASSLANQILLSKRGYETVAATLLASRLDSNGNQILVCEDGTDRVNLVFKEFK